MRPQPRALRRLVLPLTLFGVTSATLFALQGRILLTDAVLLYFGVALVIAIIRSREEGLMVAALAPAGVALLAALGGPAYPAGALVAALRTGALIVFALAVLYAMPRWLTGAREAQRDAELARRQRALLEALVDALPVPVLVVDGDDRVLFWSEAAERVTGWKAEEVVGKPYPLVPPGKEAEHAELLRRVMAGERLGGVEVHRQRKDGTPIILEAYSAPLPDAAGHISAAVVVLRDVTEQRRAERALAESIERWRAVEAASDILICEIDTRVGFRYVSPNYRTVLGYEPSELLGADIRTFLHPDDVQEVTAEIRRAMTEGRPGHAFFRFRRRDGSWRWFESTGVVFGHEGEPRGVIVSRDITERRELEAARAATEQRLRAIVRGAPVILFALDAEGVLTAVEGSTLDAYIGSPDEVVGRSVFEIHADDPQALEYYRRALAGETGRGVVRFRDRFLETFTSPIIEEGRVTAVVGVATDITEQLRAAELEVRAREAEAAERAKTELLSVVSHELRSPLTTIRGYVSTLLEYYDRLDDADIVTALRATEAAAAHLERLIDDLLTMSRLESGMLRIEPQHVDVREVVRDALTNLAVGEERRDIRVQLPARPALVHADPVRVRQVLDNLIDNARKYSPADRPIDVTVERTKGGTVTITVRDYGPGVPESELDAIFSRFHRIRTPETAHIRGTGLGLAICKGIVEAHGGKIGAWLPEGGGLAVTVELPGWRGRRTSHGPPGEASPAHRR